MVFDSVRDTSTKWAIRSPVFGTVAAGKIVTGAIGVRAGTGGVIDVVDTIHVQRFAYDHLAAIHS